MNYTVVYNLIYNQGYYNITFKTVELDYSTAGTIEAESEL